MERVILFGTGIFARDVYVFLTHDSTYQVTAFTIDRDYIKEDTLFELPIVPFENIESIYPPDEFKMLVAVGFQKMNKLRAERYHQVKAMGYKCISYVSSKATTWPGSSIGDNCVIGSNSTISPYATIGNNVFIGPGCIIPHYTVIKDHCFLGAGVILSGKVTVEPYCFLGTNSTVRNIVTIGRECIIGAGALILEDTKEKDVFLGKPADLLPISSDELSIP